MRKLKTRTVVVLLILVLLSTIIAIGQEYKEQKAELEATQQQLADYQADELEIYPCPFCGSEDVELGETCGWYVRCNDCGALGSSHDPSSRVWDENTKAEAIEWWNHNARE